jgi:hypothetical protein
MMTDSSSGFRGQEVSTRRFEKLQDGLVLPGGCIRDIDDHLSAGERLRQSFASDGVDTRRGGCRHHLMAVLTKVRHDLFPDESASTDDNDFHV